MISNSISRSYAAHQNKIQIPGPGAFSVREQQKIAPTIDKTISRLSSGEKVLNGTTTKKHQEFIRSGNGHQPVTALPGIGPVYGSRLKADGYATVYFDTFNLSLFGILMYLYLWYN